MLAAKPLARWRDLEAECAAAVAVAGLPASPKNWLSVLLAETLVWRRDVLGAVTLGASGVAMTGAHVARPDGATVNLTKGNTTGALAGTLLSLHSCSLTPPRNE